MPNSTFDDDLGEERRGKPGLPLGAPLDSGSGHRGYPDNGHQLPIVYSCSGASSAAQMANHIAVRLDRLKDAEMSCIAGVGGDVKPLVRTAKSGRPIIVLDGCPLKCAAHILKRHGIVPTRHYDLSKEGVKKQYHEDFDPQQAAQMLDRIRSDIAPDDTLHPAASAQPST